MAGSKAEFRIVSRDLTAAALLGPGPALDAAVTQLTWFDEGNRHSRISSSDLRHLAHQVMRAAPPAKRQDLLHLLIQQPSPTARSVCAFGLTTTWGSEGQLALADKLSRDRSSLVQNHLTQALMELEAKQQQLLSQAWFQSPVASQRALAGRLCTAHPASRALEMLATLGSDEKNQVREAVVEAIVDLTERHPGEVHQFLHHWAEKPDKNMHWVITRALSRSPLNRDLPFVIDRLANITTQGLVDQDIRRWVVSVIRALARQHGDLQVHEALTPWLTGDEPIMSEIAAEALRRIA